MTTIAILATLDTKASEVEHLASVVSDLGAVPFLIDIGVVADSTVRADLASAVIAERGGVPLTELRVNPSREVASEVMVAGATAAVLELQESGAIDAVIGLGGTQGTSNCCAVMQQLPYGFPKIMVSTMASGDTSSYVGIKDITMMFSVSDILGVNPLLRQILSNAAGAAVGMASAATSAAVRRDRPVVGISNLGVLTSGTVHAMERLDQLGYESIVFHAVGSGGRAMEQLMRDGMIDAVFDYALGDLSDALLGGLRAADEKRLTVATELGIPQVIVPGGVDHIGVMLDEPNVVPALYQDRTHTFHNPSILVPRTSGGELTRVAGVIGERLAGIGDQAVFMMPLGGVSSYSVTGGALVDRESDAVFWAALRDSLPDGLRIIEVEAGAEDPAFVDRAIDELVALIERSPAEQT